MTEDVLLVWAFVPHLWTVYPKDGNHNQHGDPDQARELQPDEERAVGGGLPAPRPVLIEHLWRPVSVEVSPDGPTGG